MRGLLQWSSNAAIRERFALGLSHRLEWLVEADGSIRVIPVADRQAKHV